MGKFSFSKMLNQGPAGDRADYESGAGADQVEQSHKKGAHQNGLLAGQRAANGLWSDDVISSKSMTRWSGDQVPGQDSDES